MNKMNWIDPEKRKPEGKIFWALTEGRPESDGRDWVIRRLVNDKYGDYRSLDYSSAYMPSGQDRYSTIFAWLPLESIPIKDENFNN